jgi:hypothetical protein
MVIVLPLGPRFAGSIAAEGNAFLRTTRIRSTPSFGEEVNSSATCHKISLYIVISSQVLFKMEVYYTEISVHNS